MEASVVKFKRWRGGMKSKGFLVNVNKIKVMVSGGECDVVVGSGLVLCARKVLGETKSYAVCCCFSPWFTFSREPGGP